MVSTATLAKRRQAAALRSKSTALSRSTSSQSTNSISQMINNHNERMAHRETITQLTRSASLDTICSMAETSAASALARSVSTLSLAASQQRDQEDKAAESAMGSPSVTSPGLTFYSSEEEGEVSFEQESSKFSVSVSGASDADRSKSASISSSEMDSSAEDEDEVTPPTSPDFLDAIKKNATTPTQAAIVASTVLPIPAWRSRRVVSVIPEESDEQDTAPIAVAPKSIAPQAPIVLKPTPAPTPISSITTTERKIDWSLEEDDDDFFSEPLVFDDCTYTFQSNGIARTPTGASAPDALLVSIPTATRNYTREFLREVPYEKEAPKAAAAKAKGKASTSAARPAASVNATVAKVAPAPQAQAAGSAKMSPTLGSSQGKAGGKKGKGKKATQQPWRFTAGRDD